MKVKTDIEVWENSVLIKATQTGFSLEKTSDPDQHDKRIFFYPRSAESIKKAIEEYIVARDTINKLNFRPTSQPIE